MNNRFISNLHLRKLHRLGLRLVLTLASGLALVGCAEPANHSRSAFILVDISSDYAMELDKARTVSNYVLANLNSGDAIAVAFIDNSSFSERNIIARATFDHRPSVANQQKRQFRQQLDDFIERFRVPSYHSDVSGGVLLAADYLNETDAGQKHLFILSDLHEDLPPDLNRDIAASLKDVKVFAINVKRQYSDNRNPQEYQQRLAHWQRRIEEGGGQWRLINEMARLETAVVLR